MDPKYYREIEIDLSGLQKWELEVVEILKKAVRVIASIYEKQKNADNLGANFYPSDVTVQEVENLAQNENFTKDEFYSKSLLSPYTLVKRIDNKLVAVGYYQEYNQEIDEIIGHINDASKKYNENGHPKYAEYLAAVSRDLKNNNNDESFIKYLEQDDKVNVDITIGAFETYQDKLMSIKRAFQANLRITDQKEFQKLADYVKVINAIQPADPANAVNQASNIEKLGVRIDNAVAMGGWHGDLLPVGSNYPNDPDLYKFGMKVLIYLNVIKFKYENFINVVKIVFDEKSYGNITSDLVIKSISKTTTFHEVAEAISNIKYNYYKGKLKDLSDVVRELNADLTGIKAASIHVLNGLMTADEYKNIVITSISNGVRRYFLAKDKSGPVKIYAEGWMFIISYFLKEGGLKIVDTGDGRKFSADFQTLYSNIANLETLFSEIMVKGDYENAKSIMNKYSCREELSIFDESLKKHFK